MVSYQPGKHRGLIPSEGQSPSSHPVVYLQKMYVSELLIPLALEWDLHSPFAVPAIDKWMYFQALFIVYNNLSCHEKQVFLSRLTFLPNACIPLTTCKISWIQSTFAVLSLLNHNKELGMCITTDAKICFWNGVCKMSVQSYKLTCGMLVLSYRSTVWNTSFFSRP